MCTHKRRAEAAWGRLGSVAPLLPGATGPCDPPRRATTGKPKCCHRVYGLFRNTTHAVTKSRCDFLENYPA